MVIGLQIKQQNPFVEISLVGSFQVKLLYCILPVKGRIDSMFQIRQKTLDLSVFICGFIGVWCQITRDPWPAACSQQPPQRSNIHLIKSFNQSPAAIASLSAPI